MSPRRSPPPSPSPRSDLTDEDREFLAGYDAAEFERPSVAVDVVVMGPREDHLGVVVVRRAALPFKGRFALPGGFVKMRESLDEAARRVLRDKAGLRDVFLEQLYTFGAPHRDPRTRVISVAYYALVDGERLAAVQAGPLGAIADVLVPWRGETGGPVEVRGEDGKGMPLAFDHADVIGMAIKRVRGKLDYAPIGFQLLPETFTLRALQDVHELVLGRPLNKDSFRRRMLTSGMLEATGELQQEVDHRPAELYRFRQRSAV